MKKKALLIAGGGTLGGYTYPELLKRGWQVDILDVMPRVSLNNNLHWIQKQATDEVLAELFSNNKYDVIVDFIHYSDPEKYKKRGTFLLENTDQLIFLSSYRVYADVNGIITEDSPHLIDTVQDEYFLKNEAYAIPKSKNERFLRTCGKKNWTIIRPMISFSSFRLDLITSGAPMFFVRARQGKKTLLPKEARYLYAGVGWAGNVGKEIAGLCGTAKALGEAFNVGSPEVQVWNDVAETYTDILGGEYVWVSNEDYLANAVPNTYEEYCCLHYDRLFNRRIDVSKVLSVAGIDEHSLLSAKDAIITELENLSCRPDLLQRFDDDEYRELNRKTDEYLKKNGF